MTLMYVDFFNKSNIIRNIGNHNIILVGDFNQLSNMELDKSNIKQTSTVVNLDSETMIDKCCLIDIWRTLHRLEKDFTFFLSPASVLLKD